MAWKYDIREVQRTFELMVLACDLIEDAGACEKCPLAGECMSETSFYEIANCVNLSDVEDMFDLAADIEEYGDSQSYMEEMARQANEDSSWLEDEWRRSQ